MPGIELRQILTTMAIQEKGFRWPDEEELALIQRVSPEGFETGSGLCGYLEGLRAKHLAVYPVKCTPELYEELLARNYRRNGEVFYRPLCSACTACRNLRVLVDEFTPNRSMRRCWKRNADLRIRVRARHTFTKEYHWLYEDYIIRRHWFGRGGSTMTGDTREFYEFLVASCLPGPRCVEFRLRRRLLAVGVFDETPNSYSAVYCYYDCDHARRSLGTFNILWLIDHARNNGKKYVYLGYYVDSCPLMNYKAKFLPHERWHPDGRWERVDRIAKPGGDEDQK